MLCTRFLGIMKAGNVVRCQVGCLDCPLNLREMYKSGLPKTHHANCMQHTFVCVLNSMDRKDIREFALSYTSPFSHFNGVALICTHERGQSTRVKKNKGHFCTEIQILHTFMPQHSLPVIAYSRQTQWIVSFRKL